MKDLIAYINSTTNNSFNQLSSTFPMLSAGMGVGYANGYVAVPRDHPFFGKDYDDVDICVVIGTSFNVYPAAGLVGFVDPDNPIYYIDPKPAYTPDYPGIQVIKATATAGMKELISKLKENDQIH